MAYKVQKDNAVSILHIVRTLDGSSFKTGEAANVTTALYDEAGVSSANTVTITEIGTTGEYLAAFTPDVAGVWLLQLSNPAGSDEGTYDYAVTVEERFTAETNLLTSLARVKELMWSEMTTAPTDHDDLLNNIISEVSADLTARLGRTLIATAYTEYYDGNGSATMTLRQGPMVTLTQVDCIAYSDGGGGARSETATTVEAYQYVPAGMRADGHNRLASVELLASKFTRGTRNYKIQYTAGFAAVPEAIVGHATRRVASHFLNRDTLGMRSKTIEDADFAPMSPAALQLDEQYALRPYMIQVIA